MGIGIGCVVNVLNPSRLPPPPGPGQLHDPEVIQQLQRVAYSTLCVAYSTLGVTASEVSALPRHTCTVLPYFIQSSVLFSFFFLFIFIFTTHTVMKMNKEQNGKIHIL